MPHFAIALVVSLLLSGCASSKAAKAVQARHAAEYGCKASEVKVSPVDFSDASGSGSMKADGCGETAFYICNGNLCARNSESRTSGGRQLRASSRKQASAPEVVKTERLFDEKRSVAMVRATVPTNVEVTTTMVGAPALIAGRVGVLMKGHTYDRVLQGCEQLTLWVNERPISPVETKHETQGPDIKVESQFEIAELRALSQQYATFAIGACTRKWAVKEDQMSELQKFLVIYDQLAAEAAGQAAPQTAVSQGL